MRNGYSARLSTLYRARRRVATRAGLAIGIPLLVGAISGHSSWGAVASIGGFAGFYGRDASLPRSLTAVAAVGAALIVVFPLGYLCAPQAWLDILFVFVVALVSSFVCMALRVPPPREYLIVLAALAATGIPHGSGVALRDCALVAAGVVGAVVLAAAFGAAAKPAPEVRAVAAVWDELLALLRQAGTTDTPTHQRTLVAALRAAQRMLWRTRSANEALSRSLAAAEALTTAALSVSVDARTPFENEWLNAVEQLAASEVAQIPEPKTGPEVTLRTGLHKAAMIIEHGQQGDEHPPVQTAGPLAVMRAAATRRSVIVPAAARVGVAVATGAALGRILGLDHSYWVGLTAAAALQANSFNRLRRRSLERLAGTLVGVALAAGIFALGPSAVLIALIATAAQFIAELVIVDSYAIAVIFISVIALSVFDLAVPGHEVASAFGARALDTAIGVALVLVLRRLLWPRATALRIPGVQAQTIRAAAQTLSARWLGGSDDQLVAARAALGERLLNLLSVADETESDQLTAGVPALLVTAPIEELALLALGTPHGRERPGREQAERMIERLQTLADAVDGDTRPPREGDYVEVTNYPRLTAATGFLQDTIAPMLTAS